MRRRPRPRPGHHRVRWRRLQPERAAPLGRDNPLNAKTDSAPGSGEVCARVRRRARRPVAVEGCDIVACFLCQMHPCAHFAPFSSFLSSLSPVWCSLLVAMTRVRAAVARTRTRWSRAARPTARHLWRRNAGTTGSRWSCAKRSVPTCLPRPRASARPKPARSTNAGPTTASLVWGATPTEMARTTRSRRRPTATACLRRRPSSTASRARVAAASAQLAAAASTRARRRRVRGRQACALDQGHLLEGPRR